MRQDMTSPMKSAGLLVQGLSPAVQLVVRILQELGFGEVRHAIRRRAEPIKVDVLEATADEVPDTLKELVVFASVLSRDLRIGTTDQADAFTTALFDVRLQHWVGSNLEEQDAICAFISDHLVNSSAKEHGVADVVPTIVDVVIALKPLSICHRHNPGNGRLSSLGQE